MTICRQVLSGMGANHSSNAGGSSRQTGSDGHDTGSEMRSCYYELLGIDRQAPEDE